MRSSHVPFKELRELVLSRDGYRCNHCGATQDLVVDYVNPFKLEQVDDVSILETTCPTHRWSPKGRQS